LEGTRSLSRSKNVSSELRTHYFIRKSSIEEKLLRYSKHKNPIIQQQFKHVPAYLRDLLYAASTFYTSVPSSCVRLVTELLGEYEHELLFIILNYDTLLESASQLFDPRISFNSLPRYISPNRDVKIVKIHGSVNWFRTISTDPNIS